MAVRNLEAVQQLQNVRRETDEFRRVHPNTVRGCPADIDLSVAACYPSQLLQFLLKSIEEALCEDSCFAVRECHQDTNPPDALLPFCAHSKWQQSHQRAKQRNEP